MEVVLVLWVGSLLCFLNKTTALTITQAQAAGVLANTGIILVTTIVPAQKITEPLTHQPPTLDKSLGPSTFSPEGPEELIWPAGSSPSFGVQSHIA